VDTPGHAARSRALRRENLSGLCNIALGGALQREKERPIYVDLIWEVVPVEGVEPSTFALRMRCSTN
jgi:hypothetical protein